MIFGSIKNLNSMSGLGASGSSQFSPIQIPGLVAWVDATTGVYSDAGITPATNNQTVQQWNDKSGNNNNLSQATAGNRPTFQTNQQNGLPVVFFNLATDNYIGKAFTLNQPEHVFLAFKQGTWIGGNGIVDGGTLNSMDILQDNTSSADSIGLYAGSQNCHTSPTALPVGTFGIFDAVFNSSSSSVRVNNGTKVTGNAGTNNGGGLTLGARAEGSAPGISSIGEVLVYNTALPDSLAALVIRYLGLKWGVSVS